MHCYNRNFRLPILLLGLLLCCAGGQSLAETAPPLWGRPVTHLQLECDCSLKLQNFSGAVTQQIGAPLDAGKVSESLKRLYATGRFSDLRAEGAAEGDGVSLAFVARAQYFIGIVTAEGNPGPVEAQDDCHLFAVATRRSANRREPRRCAPTSG